MDATNQTDAQLLWEDALAVLSTSGMPPQAIAMLGSLVPVDLTDEKLTVSTSAGFVKRNVERLASQVEAVLAQVSFMTLTLEVVLERPAGAEVAPQSVPTPAPTQPEAATQPQTPPATTEGVATQRPYQPPAQAESATQPHKPLVSGSSTSITPEQFQALMAARKGGRKTAAPVSGIVQAAEPERKQNPLVDCITPEDAKLTFDTFVESAENRFALQAAKQVANGYASQYNPLFIHGSSGLGKTHLLKAIQNYIAANEPERQCVYRLASDFIDDYVSAMQNKDAGLKDALTENYRNVDVLIIDDIQHLKSGVQTVEFFFNTFNHLVSHGKQIVIAADVKPSELGMEERISSRIAQGFEVSVQTPEYEFKRILIETFYHRMRDSGMPEFSGTLTADDLTYMAGKAGGNIRLIKAYTQGCLMHATETQRKGGELTKTDLASIAKDRWPTEGKIVTIEEIQAMVEKQYGVNHTGLIGEKRSKEFMEPRHVAIWMSRELTDNTLAEIGEHFGGRSHGTVKHSIAWVEDRKESDRMFFDKLVRLRQRLEE